MKGRNRQHVPVVVGLGEMLWDVFTDSRVFGGAPANFACHAAGFGCETYMVSAVGEDQPGEDAIASLKNKGVSPDYVQRVQGLETGRVNVRVNATGQPDYEIQSNVAWDRISWQSDLDVLAQQCDAVCFGTLAQRSEVSRKTIKRFLQQTRRQCLKVFDVNLRQNFFSLSLIAESLKECDILKLNNEELETVCRATGVEHTEPEVRICRLAEKYNLELVALTAGSGGSLLFAGGDFSRHTPQDSVLVCDTIGAGDAFAATAAYGYLKGWSLDRINELASRVAGFVCTKAGATPSLPDTLRNTMTNDSS